MARNSSRLATAATYRMLSDISHHQKWEKIARKRDLDKHLVMVLTLANKMETLHSDFWNGENYVKIPSTLASTEVNVLNIPSSSSNIDCTTFDVEKVEAGKKSLKILIKRGRNG